MSSQNSVPPALNDLLDPLLDAGYKGFPHHSPALRRSAIGAQGWSVLRGDMPLPLAVIRQDALQHNVQWMQSFVQKRGIGIAPHGKTTMSPQLFERQLQAGAWGMSFASVTQLRAGLAAGAQRCIIANQVFRGVDLHAIAELIHARPTLQIVFLVDSLAQLELIEAWRLASSPDTVFDVLLEVGIPGGRTGCRDHAQALTLAERLYLSPSVRLVGVECYEGLAATGESAKDSAYTQELMLRFINVVRACDERHLFDAEQVLVTAGGSAIFDLVATHLKPVLSRPVQGLLRSGCYITHDQGNYKRMSRAMDARIGCGDGLHAAMQVWAAVQSCPEPGLAILTVGKRDISYDQEMPCVLQWCKFGSEQLLPPSLGWKISNMNDQHAYLNFDVQESAAPPERDLNKGILQVGDLVCLGLSHPCTTFDKWRWMPLVDEKYQVLDAIITCF